MRNLKREYKSLMWMESGGEMGEDRRRGKGEREPGQISKGPIWACLSLIEELTRPAHHSKTEVVPKALCALHTTGPPHTTYFCQAFLSFSFLYSYPSLYWCNSAAPFCTTSYLFLTFNLIFYWSPPTPPSIPITSSIILTPPPSSLIPTHILTTFTNLPPTCHTSLSALPYLHSLLLLLFTCSSFFLFCQSSPHLLCVIHP